MEYLYYIIVYTIYECVRTCVYNTNIKHILKRRLIGPYNFDNLKHRRTVGHLKRTYCIVSVIIRCNLKIEIAR